MIRETATQLADLPHEYVEVAIAGSKRCDVCGGPQDEYLHGDVFAPERAAQRPTFRVELGS